MSRVALFGGAISAAKSLLQKLDVGTNQGVRRSTTVPPLPPLVDKLQ